MLDWTIANPISYLTDSDFGLARLLVVAAFITAVVLLVQRKPNRNPHLARAFAAAGVAMAIIAWDVNRVTTTEPRMAMIVEPSGVYSGLIFITAKSNQIILLLGGIVLLFLCVQIWNALRARKTLTWGAGFVALTALLMVHAEQIKYLGDMSSPVWHVMAQVDNYAWDVLFGVVVCYVIVLACTFATRYAVKVARENSAASPAATEATGSMPVR